MGRLFLEALEGRVYSCGQCGAHLAKAEELISKVGLAQSEIRLHTSQSMRTCLRDCISAEIEQQEQI